MRRFAITPNKCSPHRVSYYVHTIQKYGASLFKALVFAKIFTDSPNAFRQPVALSILVLV